MKLRKVTASIVITISLALWLKGFLQSPMVQRELHHEQQFVERYLRENAPDMEEERKLADAYWQRYPDVGQDNHYGRNGTMGIFGARSHFDQHGKQEGRVWGLP